MTTKNDQARVDPDTQEQIALFEKFLGALEAGRQAIFSHTKTCLRLRRGEANFFQVDLQERIRLVRRTLVVLREGFGRLVVTKGSGDFFEFWVESYVIGALPPHRWTSSVRPDGQKVRGSHHWRSSPRAFACLRRGSAGIRYAPDATCFVVADEERSIRRYSQA
jgi:hypothetical protein